MDTMAAINRVLNKPYGIMGIVNVTPDSFYDGGRFRNVNAAVEHAGNLIAEGADIIDIGGASSRPGAEIVSPEEETGRVIPVISIVAKAFPDAVISVDTTHSSVACAALDAGASIINDVSAGRDDPRMPDLAAQRGCAVVLMHSRGTPQSMQGEARYSDVVLEVKNELMAAVERFREKGVAGERIIIDPGIGFAKTPTQSVAILQGLKAFTGTGYPVLVGTSRKSFIGKMTGREATERLAGTLGSLASAWFRGARLFRMHDVAATVDFLKVLSGIESFEEPGARERDVMHGDR
jgi:dihydropteroate synthase